MSKASIDPGWSKGRDLTFSPGIRKGKFIFLSGIIGKTDGKGKIVSKGDMKSQTKEAYDKIRVILEMAGASLGDIVKTTDYVTTFHGYKETSEVRRELLGPEFPAATGILVAGLTNKEALIEIEVIAMLD
jgi:enamine deaminase RidA (YjgF/YER057c/UK114 family)